MLATARREGHGGLAKCEFIMDYRKNKYYVWNFKWSKMIAHQHYSNFPIIFSIRQSLKIALSLL